MANFSLSKHRSRTSLVVQRLRLYGSSPGGVGSIPGQGATCALCLVSPLCLPLCSPWTVACRLLCPRRFSRQEYWSGLPCPPPGDLPNPGIEPRSSALQAHSLPSEPPGKPTCLMCGQKKIF